MDTELLVEPHVDAGRKLIAELDRGGFVVSVAFWVKSGEDGERQLYIASPEAEPPQLGNAYQRLYTCLNRVRDAEVDLSGIKLIPVSSPIARDALAMRNRHPGRNPLRLHDWKFGNIQFDEAYVYPRVGPMDASDVFGTVLSLMTRTGSIQPSIVTFRDGSVLHAVPARIDNQMNGKVEITFRDVASGANKTVPIDDVLQIQ